MDFDKSLLHRQNIIQVFIKVFSSRGFRNCATIL